MKVLRIDELLIQRGMTERELAEKVGVSHQAVNAYVRCRARLPKKKAPIYACALGVTEEELYKHY